MDKAKPFFIPIEWFRPAFGRVKANGGIAGVDGQTIAEFEEDLENNLYKLWNRMSSGSYIPKPVMRVEIPKGDGGTRPLGIPTVADRVAQTVVKMYLEPECEEIFHPDSYGYRPGRSAVEAVGVTRKRCWWYDWVLDLDIKGFFDSIDHELVMRAVRKHTQEKWVLLYIERWLTAPVVHEDGTREERSQGTPQGGVISPLLANLYLHYAFDTWMAEACPRIPFERYADDIICHCKSRRQAGWLKTRIEARFARCNLTLNREKTSTVYCKDDDRPGNYPNQSFDFLGFTFRPRRAKNKEGKFFVGFIPAVSNKAAKAMRQDMRKLGLHRKSHYELKDLARLMNPITRGWINYYGSYYRSALSSVCKHLDMILARWAMRKYKRFYKRLGKAMRWLSGVRRGHPRLFAHWCMWGAQAG
ncbi:MAG: group II intron reverse transcriptase/maturase [Actinomycetota bacterium]